MPRTAYPRQQAGSDLRWEQRDVPESRVFRKVVFENGNECFLIVFGASLPVHANGISSPGAARSTGERCAGIAEAVDSVPGRMPSRRGLQRDARFAQRTLHQLLFTANGLVPQQAHELCRTIAFLA